jgi:hypothetical protein
LPAKKEVARKELEPVVSKPSSVKAEEKPPPPGVDIITLFCP